MPRRIVGVAGVRGGMTHDRAQRTAAMNEPFLREYVERAIHRLVGETQRAGQLIAGGQSLAFRDGTFKDLSPVMLSDLHEDGFPASVVENQTGGNIF
jgi:hypothetical protein